MNIDKMQVDGWGGFLFRVKVSLGENWLYINEKLNNALRISLK